MLRLIKQFPHCDFFFVENTVGDDSHYDYLKTLDDGVNAVEVVKHEWNPEETYFIKMLADCDNIIREYFLDNGYDYWVWTAPDIISPPNAVDNLMKCDKDAVGYAAGLFKIDGPPSCFKSGTLFAHPTGGFMLDACSWGEIDNQFMRVWGVGGVVLYKRRVLEECRFNYHEDFLWGEDCWFWSEMENKGFEMWVDGSFRAINETFPNDYVAGIESKYISKSKRDVFAAYDEITGLPRYTMRKLVTPLDFTMFSQYIKHRRQSRQEDASGIK